MQKRGLTMVRNAALTNARIAKDDEFYTKYDDIKKELVNYAKYFKGKVIYCNCDDHYGIGKGTPKSNFLKYLADNFQAFGIKKVIATHYEAGKKSTMYILNKDNTGDGIICSEDIEEIPMKGDGDFRSQECIELLKQADIVITNPPFSLFREYVTQLMKYEKKFIIIGNDNCRTYKEIFPLIKNNKLWCGYNHVKEFLKPDGSIKKFGNVGWYTNLPTTIRKEEIITGKVYSGYENMYQEYDNYEAIEISKLSNLPMDYEGVMGVPITFIDHYNPDQFEIIWTSDRGGDGFLEAIKKPHTRYDAPVVNGTGLYKRIFIRKKQGDQ